MVVGLLIDFIRSQDDRIGEGNIGHGTHVAYVLLVPLLPSNNPKLILVGLPLATRAALPKSAVPKTVVSQMLLNMKP